MIPLSDVIPTRTRPLVTTGLVIVNAALFAMLRALSAADVERTIAAVGVVPASPGIATFVTSMFVHRGFGHLAVNLLYLWIFGNNVEDVLGHVKYVIFYLLCGVLAGLTHVLFNPNSTVPTVGASGAVAGVLGAYLVMYPKARVLTLVFLGIFIRMMEVPAAVLLFVWFVMQSLQGFLSLGVNEMTGGVAQFRPVAEAAGRAPGPQQPIRRFPRAAGDDRQCAAKRGGKLLQQARKA